MAEEKISLGEKHASSLQDLERLLIWGQETGEFRPFCTHMMAMVIRNAIDAATSKVAMRDEFDFDLYATELATLFEKATAAHG